MVDPRRVQVLGRNDDDFNTLRKRADVRALLGLRRPPPMTCRFRTLVRPLRGCGTACYRRAVMPALLPPPRLLAQPAAAGLSEENAHGDPSPRRPHGLTGAQRAQFLEIAGDTFGYAGCNDTLARCLCANVTDKHAPRMAGLMKALLLAGLPPSVIIDVVERYYASFSKDKRQKLADHDCPPLGDVRAPVAVVEYSDYQCPHCAAAVQPLHDMVG